MTQAVAYRNGLSGQEEYSSGLIIHRGPLTAALVRSIGAPSTGQYVWPRDGQGSGSGLELAHWPKVQSAIQSYDREVPRWLNLDINALNINLQPQGGKVTMPQGSAQALLGYWFQASNWAIPAINQWFESTTTVNFTTTGTYPWRIDWSTVSTCPVAGQACYIGVGYDHALNWPSVSLMHIPTANFAVPCSGTIISQAPPAAGPHSVSLWMYGTSMGCGFHSSAMSGLWITEMRA